MDFYSRQAQARRQTRWLVVPFIVAMLLVVVALDLVLFAALFALADPERARFAAPLQYARESSGYRAVLHVARAGASSAYRVCSSRCSYAKAAVSWRGRSVARASRAIPRDFKRKRLHNVVEEMAIASGVPMPRGLRARTGDDRSTRSPPGTRRRMPRWPSRKARSIR